MLQEVGSVLQIATCRIACSPQRILEVKKEKMSFLAISKEIDPHFVTSLMPSDSLCNPAHCHPCLQMTKAEHGKQRRWADAAQIAGTQPSWPQLHSTPCFPCNNSSGFHGEGSRSGPSQEEHQESARLDTNQKPTPIRIPPDPADP